MLRTIAAFDRIGEENAFAVLARGTQLAALGLDIINLGIGQPDFRTPDFIVEAAVKALRDGHHGYTPSVGILPLRQAVAADLHKRFNVDVSPETVMVFPGGKPTMFICGNDDKAKAVVRGINDQFGWETADMGKAEAARAIEPLCMLWCILGFTHNEWTHAFKLLHKG